MRHALAFLIVLAVTFGLGSLAAATTGTISGRVTDASEAVVSGAKVSAQNVQTNFRVATVTNDAGLFVLANLAVGTYQVTVEKQGFQTVVQPDIILHVQDELRLAFTLPVGPVSQSVTVAGGAPVVQTDSAAVGTLVDRQFLQNIPLNGRSFQSLLQLTPGLSLTQATGAQPGQFNVNGQRNDANYFMVDGVGANTAVTSSLGMNQSGAGTLTAPTSVGATTALAPIDAIQEFKVQTSSYAPEYGRFPGAQVSIVTRSGTNEFHGTLFEYLRNDKLDANDWFGNRSRLRRPPLRQNDFGGVIGGPVIRNRTFFFFSTETLKLIQPQVSITQVPSLQSRAAAPDVIKPYLNAFPIPNGPALASNYATFQGSYSNPANLYSNGIRIDHALTSKVTIFGRYASTPSDAAQRRPDLSLNTLNPLQFTAHTLTGGAVWIVTPRLSSDLRLNGTWNSGTSRFYTDNYGGAVPIPLATLFRGAEPGPYAFSQVFFSDAAVGWINGTTLARNRQRQFNIVDTVSYTAGKHQMKFGADYRRMLPSISPVSKTEGAIFANVAQILAQTTNFTNLNIGDPGYTLVENFSLFAQDIWRLGRRLTVTYGVRWEVNPPIRGRDGTRLTNVTGLDSPQTLAIDPANGQFYATTYNNFAPRLGVAYQFRDSTTWQTVLRGGVGIFYDTAQGPAGVAGATFPGVRQSTVPSSSFPLTAAQATPRPPGFVKPYGIFYGTSDPKLKLPYTVQMNVALEQGIGTAASFTASYVGAVGHRLLRTENANQGNLNPDFTQVYYTRNLSNSDFHSLQLQFRQRLSRGLQVLAMYTWAHSIDNESSDLTLNAPARNLNLRNERGSSNFDIRHTYSFAVTYDFPKTARGGMVGALANGWSTDVNFRGRSALPVNILATGAAQFPGLPIPRPDLVPGQPLYLADPNVGGGQRFNRAAFVAPPATRQGNLARNVLRGFGANQLDAALRREFRLTDRWRLQFRAEYFNVTNTPAFGQPSGTLTSPLFGISTTTLARSLSGAFGTGLNPLYQFGSPRSGQLALKLSF